MTRIHLVSHLLELFRNGAALSSVVPSGLALMAGVVFAGVDEARADSKAVLDRLVKKGILTPEERDETLAQEAAAATPAPEAAGPLGAPKKEAAGAIAGRPQAPHKAPSTDAIGQKKDQHWYDRLRLDGYMQLRFTEQLNGAADGLDVPNDKSVRKDEGLMLRRGRVKITGDATENLHIYTQMDFQGSTGGSSLSLQARDFYGDLDLVDGGEHRLRAGLSKVPYGWVNMQSSQNRLAMERPDALNSAVEGERDYGVYYMWASKQARETYKELLKKGLKGSGDYGVFTVGLYNGQGLNKPDLNGEPHLVARLNCPWKTESGQYYEAGIGGYTGQYVVSTSAIRPVGGTTNLVPGGGTEFRDDRVFATFIMYPQPFGLEAEWTYGQGPELNGSRTRIENSELFGGYVQACYRIQTSGFDIFPFVRWNYYDGGRKFGANAPRSKVREYDAGIEWEIGKSWEVVLMYTYTECRTNTASSPYADVRDAHRAGVQLQFNF